MHPDDSKRKRKKRKKVVVVEETESADSERFHAGEYDHG
jgi:hypothetical protein